MMVLSENVQVAFEADALYCAVNVVLPGVRLGSDAADARCNEPFGPAKMTAVASEAAAVFAPVRAYDM
jgi:hypothetical protein